MITIDLGTIEYFDDDNEEFVYKEGGTVDFEYSLKAVYEWESIWKKPFLRDSHSDIELKDLYRLMASKDFDPDFLTIEICNTLARYIGDSQTATTFTSIEGQNDNNNSRGKITTSEEIYAMMFAANIPLEFENRNLNRLMVLLRVISNRNEPPKKMSQEDIIRQNSELNRQRREALKSRG